MVEFRLAIKNPVKRKYFKSFFSKTRQLSQNKFIEFEITRNRYYILEFNLDLTWRGVDHAGPSVDVSIFGYSACLRMYDHRHWNYKDNTWEVEDPMY